MTLRPPDTEPVKRLLWELGYPQFQNSALLLEALTHRSYVNEVTTPNVRDNERLEFLGDRVIDLVVSEELMMRHPDAREGALSRMRSAIVSEAALAAVASTVRLGDALRLGRGEELSGGRTKPSLLADAFEAVIAAIYLDGGMAAARDVLLVQLKFPEGSQPRVDPKTEIQEKIQGERRIAPTYRVVEESGPDHSKQFVVEILVGDDVLGRGSGRTKQEAEQSAAAAVLKQLG
ncbi:ribonuclease III [Myxococcota bacterium]|nr:ribonuclease III [Myxococcota bacterium]